MTTLFRVSTMGSALVYRRQTGCMWMLNKEALQIYHTLWQVFKQTERKQSMAAGVFSATVPASREFSVHTGVLGNCQCPNPCVG